MAPRVEGVDGVLVVGGDEHDLRARAGLSGRRRHFQAGQAGHADIQEGDVGLVLGDGFQRRAAVVALGHDLAVPATRRQAARPAPRAAAPRLRR